MRSTRRVLARDAFAAWERVKAHPAVAVFVVGLLVGDRWNRG